MTGNLSYPIGPFVAPKNIDQAQIDSWIQEIAELPAKFSATITGLSNDQLDTPYRPGGWTVRQVIHHLPDSHIGSYCRFHWALTEDNPTIKAYDEKAWANLSYQKEVPIESSLGMLDHIHARWVVLMKKLTDTDLEKTYVHPEDGKVYILREVVGMYAWHGNHHLAHVVNLKKRMDW
ncbi:YfiT family bacillithiol transferase [Roseivirga misakiensis]|uniref:Metal-dependent hydrolase n=1 Tax=Roseivirga misakiensis TaxID=1563681 RepID=A0A1E5T2B4_9BACT|nr:putative metal-dependent hydrolase [Roseivirga misakiensis]OEK05518.1 metal-dependent hydrolase [Roseivirga misakiensis]